MKAKKITFIIILQITVVFAALFLLEIILRVAGYSPAYINPLQSFHDSDDNIGWRGKKNFKGRFKTSEFNVVIEHNEYGFRKLVNCNKNISSAKRVVFFGDSFTWGWGVGQGKCFTDLLGKKIPLLQFSDYGINGSGTLSQYILFKNEILKDLISGDQVVVMFFNNDFYDNTGGRVKARFEGEKFLIDKPTKKFKSEIRYYLKNILYSYNFLDYYFNYYKLILKKKKNDENTARPGLFNESCVEYRACKYLLNQFKNDCAEKKIKLIVFYIPAQAELNESMETLNYSEKEDVLRKSFFEIISDLGITAVDLKEGLLEWKKNNGNRRITFPHDEHWNESGHIAASEIIGSYITQ